MLRTLSLLAVLALTAAPASAQSKTADTLDADDAAVIEQCLESVGSQGEQDPSMDAESCIGAAADLCMETPDGGTTIGMAQCHQRETAWWDDRLNADYAELESMLAPESFEDLQTAQRAWIDYRDADCAFAYAFWGDGSIRTVVAAQCMLDHTARRALALQGFLGWQ